MIDTDLSKTSRALPVLDKLIQFSLFTFVAFSMFSISVTQISFAIGALSWLLKVHLTKTWKELSGTLVGLAILCFCLACVLSIVTSVDLESSLKLLKKLIQFVILFWVANTVQDEKQRDLLFKLVILAGVAAAIYGLVPLLNPGSFSPERLYAATRPIGTMSVPSTFSGILMIVGLVALGRLLFRKPKEYWVLGSAGIISLGLLLTLTRQAWLGFFIGSVFLLFFWNKKYLIVVPLLLVGLLLFGPERIKDRMHSYTNLKDDQFRQRVLTWKGGWRIFKDHPITGCGFKCVDSIHSQYPDPSGYVEYFRGMHSNIFQLLVDTGIVGFGTWLSIWATYFIEVFKRWKTLAREKSQDNAAGILMGSSAAIIGFLVGGFFETNIYDSEIAMLVYFLMGLSLAQTKKLPESSVS
ncbi:MAG: O-antigen ligase family protein [Nitrospinae bacterium]|nr:O-antigen ligase family protein [Nitrospinota bacterium]